MSAAWSTARGVLSRLVRPLLLVRKFTPLASLAGAHARRYGGPAVITTSGRP